jgi:hypothetical protein
VPIELTLRPVGNSKLVPAQLEIGRSGIFT